MTPETATFMEALDDLEQALDRTVEMAERMHTRIVYLREQCQAERPLHEVVMDEQPPLVVQLLTESANILHTYGTRVRRTEARALHREGVTMEEIARLFGVSRQRVSALLRDSATDATA
jgi:DNA-directed RNA polymerase sigma subunit (sigma70/sigma32)